VHEDFYTAGFGAEIAATITHEAFSSLDAPVIRLATDDCLIPYNPGLMDAVVPTPETIRGKIEELLKF
jgi:2-oxoisovalerate dehydrogenase E1 component